MLRFFFFEILAETLNLLGQMYTFVEKKKKTSELKNKLK